MVTKKSCTKLKMSEFDDTFSEERATPEVKLSHYIIDYNSGVQRHPPATQNALQKSLGGGQKIRKLRGDTSLGHPVPQF